MSSIGIKNLPHGTNFYLESHKLGLIFVLDNYVVISQKPDLIKKNNFGLHCEDGPALTYDDNGISDIYALNGVVMTKEYVETPAERLNPKDIIAETNVGIRRELIRKVGIERMLEQLEYKVIDKRDNYELLNIKLSNEVSDTRYLRMQNPSVNCWHLEGCEGNSVQEALNWRAKNLIKNGENWNPSVLT
jgi:hypothetical protein